MSQRFFLIVLFLLLCLRSWIATLVNLGVDEAHYYWYGKNLDWSYFDHPPIVGWIHWLFQKFLNQNELAARIPAILNSLVTSLLAVRYLIKHGTSENNARWAVLSLNTTLLFNLQSIMLLPDSILMPLSFLVVEWSEKAIEENRIKDWLILGALLGLSALTKYTAIFFVFALIVSLFKNRRWKSILKGKFLFGALLTLFMLYPLWHWNMKNQFISFKYQSDHIFNFKNISFLYLLQTQIIQFIFWGGGLYLICIKHLSSCQFYQTSNKNGFANILAILLFTTFLFISFSQLILPHWLLIVLVFLLPLAVSSELNFGNFKKMFVFSLASLIITLSFFLELQFHLAPKSWRPMIYKQLVGWPTFMEQANEWMDKLDSPHKAIGVMNWTLGSRSLYYNLHQSKIFVIDQKFNQFDLWNPETPRNKDFILMIEGEKTAETLPQIDCLQLSFLNEVKIYIKDTVVNSMSYYKCLEFRGLK